MPVMCGARTLVLRTMFEHRVVACTDLEEAPTGRRDFGVCKVRNSRGDFE